MEVSEVFMCICVLAENRKTVFAPDGVLNKVNTDLKVYILTDNKCKPQQIHQFVTVQGLINPGSTKS